MTYDGDFATADEIHQGLRIWAKGSLPLMAAVEFVIGSGENLHRAHPMVDIEIYVDDQEHARATGRVALEVFEDSDHTWGERTGWMSGGQLATWELARSIARGEIDRWFWRLDEGRQRAFIDALVNYGAPRG